MLQLSARLFAAVLAAAVIVMPDPNTGVIGGQPAILGWPAILRADGYPGDLLPAGGCDVHLALFDEPEREVLFPCGKWFVPRPSRYWMWLEQGETISGQSQLLATGAGGSVGKRNVYPMVPAGRVSTDATVTDVQAARFLNLRPEYRAFLRSARGPAAKTQMRMPAGRIAGGIFDRKSGDAVAFFRPFELTAGQRFHASLLEQKEAGVFAVLKSPQVRRKRLGVALRVNDRVIVPDDVIDAGIRTYAFWYSVKGARAKLEVTNDAVTYDGPELVLRAGAIATRRDDLRQKSGP